MIGWCVLEIPVGWWVQKLLQSATRRLCWAILKIVELNRSGGGAAERRTRLSTEAIGTKATGYAWFHSSGKIDGGRSNHSDPFGEFFMWINTLPTIDTINKHENYRIEPLLYEHMLYNTTYGTVFFRRLAFGQQICPVLPELEMQSPVLKHLLDLLNGKALSFRHKYEDKHKCYYWNQSKYQERPGRPYCLG